VRPPGSAALGPGPSPALSSGDSLTKLPRLHFFGAFQLLPGRPPIGARDSTGRSPPPPGRSSRRPVIPRPIDGRTDRAEIALDPFREHGDIAGPQIVEPGSKKTGRATPFNPTTWVFAAGIAVGAGSRISKQGTVTRAGQRQQLSHRGFLRSVRLWIGLADFGAGMACAKVSPPSAGPAT